MRLLIGATLLLLFVTPANAQEAHDWYSGESSRVQSGRSGHFGYGYPRARRGKAKRSAANRSNTRRAVRGASYANNASILAHPAGCPRRLFCGCGASVKVFGKPVRSLYLARNWLKFPRAAAAPGMVAANRRHVMVIEQVMASNKAVVYDANSGRGLTRRHVRSLAGFTVVNPRASRVASLPQ